MGDSQVAWARPPTACLLDERLVGARLVETAAATTSRMGVSSQGAGLGATADPCPVPDSETLGAMYGRLVHG